MTGGTMTFVTAMGRAVPYSDLQTPVATPLHVIRFHSSDETVRALKALLTEAMGGRLIGIAYVAMHGHRSYSVGIEGETRKSPTFTRGMLHVLDDELAAIIRGR